MIFDHFISRMQGSNNRILIMSDTLYELDGKTNNQSMELSKIAAEAISVSTNLVDELLNDSDRALAYEDKTVHDADHFK